MKGLETRKCVRNLWLTSCSAMALTSAPALAQTAGESTPPTTAASTTSASGSVQAGGQAGATEQAAVPQSAAAQASDTTVGDIVVTAQKRSEALSRVGLTVAALTGDTLTNQNIRNVADLATVLPGLTFSATQTSTPVYTLRGVGFYETALAGYPAVSVYVDEVPLPFPALTTMAAFDLERVEVLKGPQGILFGQNSTGGAINYIARKPSDDFQLGFSSTYGRFNEADLEAYVGGPITSNLRARLAFRMDRADDWQYSYFARPGDTTGKTRRYGARFGLAWDASDRLRVSLNLNGFIDRSDPQAPQYAALSPLRPADPIVTNYLANYPLAPRNDRAADWSLATAPRGNERMGQGSVRADYDLSDAVSLTSITSYLRYNRNDRTDIDGVAASTLDFSQLKGRISSFFQELRLSNGGRHGFRWTVGANYERSKVYDFQNYYYPDSSISNYFAAFVGHSSWNGSPYFTDQRMRNYASFGNAELDLGSMFTIKGGLRYTKNNRDFSGCSYDDGQGTFADIQNAFNGNPDGTLAHPIPHGGCITLLRLPKPAADGDTVDSQVLQREKLNQSNLSWRAGLDFKSSADFLAYGNISRGYKAGGFSTLSATYSDQFRPVFQESLLAYEAGIKTKLFSRRIQFNAAAFYYDYTDKQLRSFGNFPPFGFLPQLQNIPKSRIKGVEAEVSGRPFVGLTLAASGTYLDAKVTRFTGLNSFGVPGDYAGADIPYTPKWSGSVSADYEAPVSSTIRAFVGSTVSYKSSQRSDLGQGGGIGRIDPYTLLDLRAGIETTDGRWRLQFWGKNVTDKFYVTNTLHAFDTDVRFTGRPATYGATLSWRY